jgi:transposase
LSQDNLFYLDESGFDERQSKPSGYCLKGERLNIKVTGLRTKRRSVIALRDNNNKLVEPITFQETANSLLIYQYFQLIRDNIVGKITVVLDNASCHKSKPLRAYCERNDITLIYLPPYSPDLNKIEKMWGTIKKIMKRISQNGKELGENLQTVLNSYTLEKV